MIVSRWRARLSPYFMVLPGWLWLVVFFVVPTLSMLSVSTMTGNSIDGFSQTFHLATYSQAWSSFHVQIVRSLAVGEMRGSFDLHQPEADPSTGRRDGAEAVVHVPSVELVRP